MSEKIPEDALLEAANAFRNTLLEKADGRANGVYPYWFGWAIFDAYVAGVRAERERAAKIVEDHQEVTNLSKGGTTLMPRVAGNQAGLAFAAAIRASNRGEE
jgi:hypothetical protein